MNPNFKIFDNILGSVGSANEFHGIAFKYLSPEGRMRSRPREDP